MNRLSFSCCSFSDNRALRLVAVVVLVLILCGTFLRNCHLARQYSWRAGGKLDPKVLAALPDLSLRAHGGIGLPAYVHPTTLSGRTSVQTSSKQGLWWPASARANVSSAQLSVPVSTTARMRNPSMSAMEKALSGESSSAVMPSVGIGQPDAIYTNLYRLGFTRTYSRRSLSATSPDLE